jgi:hypothetical protein
VSRAEDVSAYKRFARGVFCLHRVLRPCGAVWGFVLLANRLFSQIGRTLHRPPQRARRDVRVPFTGLLESMYRALEFLRGRRPEVENLSGSECQDGGYMSLVRLPTSSDDPL